MLDVCLIMNDQTVLVGACVALILQLEYCFGHDLAGTEARLRV